MPPVFFYTVGGAILYCATPPYTSVGADAARFFYGWLRDPLLCYPPYITVGADAARLFLRLAARSSTVLPPPYITVGRPFTVLPPLHYT